MSDIVVILLHGFNVSDPRRTVGKLRKYFEAKACLVESHPYGYWPWPWQMTKHNPNIARDVAGRVRYWRGKGYRVFIACHSNGAVITRLASMIHKAEITRVLAIHPALRKHLLVSNTSERVLVVHNDGDKAVTAGGFLGRIGRRLVPDSWRFRPWGSMGRVGYTGKNNTHMMIDSADKTHSVTCWGHGEEFEAGKAEYWLPYLVDRLLED